MAAEFGSNLEGPRTQVSFFSEGRERDYMLEVSPEELMNNFQVNPDTFVQWFHELWRNGKEQTMFDAIRGDRTNIAILALNAGCFVNDLSYLNIRCNESLSRCHEFLVEAVNLIDTALLGLPSIVNSDLVPVKPVDYWINEIYSDITKNHTDYLCVVN